MRVITVAQVRLIYDTHVQAGVLRDPGLLEHAVRSPFQDVFGVELYPTLAQKAGELLDGIQRVQAYTDGNKRLAWHATMAFLDLNGQRLTDAEPHDVDDFVRSLAGEQRGELIAAVWLNDRMTGL